MKPHFNKAPSPPRMSRMKLKPKDIEAFMTQLFGSENEGTEGNALKVLSKSIDKSAIKTVAEKMIGAGEIDLDEDSNINKLAIIDRPDFLEMYLKRYWIENCYFDLDVAEKVFTRDEKLLDREAQTIADFMIQNSYFSDYLIHQLVRSLNLDKAEQIYDYFSTHGEYLTFSEMIMLFGRLNTFSGYSGDEERFALAEAFLKGEVTDEEADKAHDLIYNDFIHWFTAENDTTNKQYDFLTMTLYMTPEDRERFENRVLDGLKPDDVMTLYTGALLLANMNENAELSIKILEKAALSKDARQIYLDEFIFDRKLGKQAVVRMARKYGVVTDEELREYAKSRGAELTEETAEPEETELIQEEPEETAEEPIQKEKKVNKDTKKRYIIKNNNADQEETANINTDMNSEADLTEEIITQEEEDDQAFSTGRYICAFEVRDTDTGMRFWNFRPLAQIRDSGLYGLMPGDYDYLIPDSERKNINLRHNGSAASKESTEKAAAMIYNGALLAVDIDPRDLEPNLNPTTGKRNATGYKISCDELIKKDGLHMPDEIGYYRVIKKKHTRGDIYKDRYIYIDNWLFNENTPEKIYIDLGEFYAGPYDVRYRVADSEYFVIPDVSSTQVISGYAMKDAVVEHLHDAEFSGYSQIWANMEEDRYEWLVLDKKASRNYSNRDLMTEKDVIDMWLRQKEKGEGSDVSLPFVVKAPAEIRERRMKVIEDFVASDEKMKALTRSMDEAAIRATFNPENDERIKDFVSEYVSRHQEIVSTTQAFQNRVKEANHLKEEIEEIKMAHESKVAELEEKIAEAAQEASKVSQLAEETAELETVRAELGRLKTESELMEKDIQSKRQHRNSIISENALLEDEFSGKLGELKKKMLDFSVDGFIAAKMSAAASSWEQESDYEQFTKLVKEAADEPVEDMSPDALIQYLVDTIHKVRPRYSANDIINIMTCISQGFLTVFSGAPGVGKTSICNIFSEVLGLGKDDFTGRYIPVSVEKGWVSKRDFIGYFNPLTGRIDRTNATVFNALKLLDIEKKNSILRQPYLILLDEANLSPMEYYWSDFMDVCDDEKSPMINLGEDHVYQIPETLRFVATVNNDHTTEIFSPRLLDRAWIVTLPRVSSVGAECEGYTASELKKVSWASIRSAFRGDGKLTTKQRELMDGLQKKFRLYRSMYISPRAELAVQRYCSAATPLFKEDDYGSAPEIVALDFAVSQKILPKISGQGEQYEKWLTGLKEFCESSGLSVCAQRLSEIIDDGNASMKYYHFF